MNTRNTPWRASVIYTQDGKTYAGRTAADVVQNMMDGNAFTQGKDRADYMRTVSRRADRLEGEAIDATTPETFLTTLQAAGLITIGDAQ